MTVSDFDSLTANRRYDLPSQPPSGLPRSDMGTFHRSEVITYTNVIIRKAVGQAEQIGTASGGEVRAQPLGSARLLPRFLGVGERLSPVQSVHQVGPCRGSGDHIETTGRRQLSGPAIGPSLRASRRPSRAQSAVIPTTERDVIAIQAFAFA